MVTPFAMINSPSAAPPAPSPLSSVLGEPPSIVTASVIAGSGLERLIGPMPGLKLIRSAPGFVFARSIAVLREPDPISALVRTVKVVGDIGDKVPGRTARADRLEINATQASKITNPVVVQSESLLFILLLSNRRS